MEEIAKLEMSLLNDRGLRKVRVNIMKGNHITGFIKSI
jgi:hypothetical protein